MQSEFESQIAELIVEAVNLEDISPDSIDPDAQLFGYEGGSLGLDSIDALEIAMAIAKKYQVQIKADDENNLKIFASLRSLAEFVESQLA